MSVFSDACYLTLLCLCACVCVLMLVSGPLKYDLSQPVPLPFETCSSGPLGLTPSQLCLMPPFETLMAPAGRVTEWVGDNRAGIAAIHDLCLPLVPLVSKHRGEDNTLHVLFLNIMFWPCVLQSCHLIDSLMYRCCHKTCRPLWGVMFWTVQLRVGWLWQLILLSQAAVWSYGAMNEACFFTFQYDSVNVSMVFRTQGSFFALSLVTWIGVFVLRYRSLHCKHRSVKTLCTVPVSGFSLCCLTDSSAQCGDITGKL